MLERLVRKMLTRAGWSVEPGLPFYMVGGSWRALARLHQALRRHPELAATLGLGGDA